MNCIDVSSHVEQSSYKQKDLPSKKGEKQGTKKLIKLLLWDVTSGKLHSFESHAVSSQNQLTNQLSEFDLSKMIFALIYKA